MAKVGGRANGSGRRPFTFCTSLLLAASGWACSASGPSPSASVPAVIEQRHLQVAGGTREYRLFTPPNPARALPLVVALHGGGNRARSLIQATQLDRAAEHHGFLVAYPEADGVWNGGFCCTGGRGDPRADVLFLDSVITDIASRRDVDESRVYVVGVSAGAVMAYRLACDLAPRIAGIGSVAGTMLLDDCHPARPVSVLEIHGTADHVVPYEGGSVLSPRVASARSPSVPAVAERWAGLDHCPAPATLTVSGSVTTTSWAGCAGDTTVRLVTVAGGGHTWFAKEFGQPDGAVDATDTFLEAFGLAKDG